MSHWQRVGLGFAVFFIIIWFNAQFIAPFLSGPVGGLLSVTGALSVLLSSLVLAFVGYWLYAIVVRKTGAEPEA